MGNLFTFNEDFANDELNELLNHLNVHDALNEQVPGLAATEILSDRSQNTGDGHVQFQTKVEISVYDADGEKDVEDVQNKEAIDPVLSETTLEGIVEHITKNVSKIVCMCGAGVSVSAGIPDFRSPGTGLYDNLQQYNLPYPEAVFDLQYFRQHPEPFFLLAKELMPGGYKPTLTHHFIKLLHDKGLLLRCYSQNIDSLETAAGLPPEKLVAAHGNFDMAACIDCKKEVPFDVVKEAVWAGKVSRCISCQGLVKPSIVFFSEDLPARFHELYLDDLQQAELLIVMGTSLSVVPFANLVDCVTARCPRLLINREDSAPDDWYCSKSCRDVLALGDCDTVVQRFADLLGWGDDLCALFGAVTSKAKTRSATVAAERV